MELKLYEITEDIATILQAEEWTEEAETRLESLGLALEKKAENIVHFVAELEMFNGAAKAEEKRLAERRRASENRIKHLKDYMQRCLNHAERTEVEAGTYKVKLQKNPARVVVDAEENIPPRFFTIIPETKQLDRKAVAEALKKGEVIVGAHLEQGMSLRIR
jgi:hypothetical protein